MLGHGPHRQPRVELGPVGHLHQGPHGLDRPPVLITARGPLDDAQPVGDNFVQLRRHRLRRAPEPDREVLPCDVVQPVPIGAGYDLVERFHGAPRMAGTRPASRSLRATGPSAFALMPHRERAATA